ncbi:hypothetical protein PMAYCL1PPCAC_08995, partial [Pristionchus mayeri]
RIRTMRLFLFLLPLVCFSSAQEAAFLKKFNTLLTSFFKTNTPKLVNLVFDGLVAQKSNEEIKKDLEKNAMGFVPKDKILTAVGALSTYMNCMKKTGSKNPNATTEAVVIAGNKFIAPLGKKIKDKISAMKKNKKPDSAIKTEAYKIATAGLTKKLIQSCINVVKNKITQPEWNCALPPLKEFTQASFYDLTWTKSG